MTPSEIGLAVYRHQYLENGQWMLGGYALAVPDNINPETDRYELTDEVPEDVGGIAVYLFDSELQRTGFIAGLYAAGDQLKSCASGVTNLGCPALIYEYPDHAAFCACARSEVFAQIAVFDYRTAGAGTAAKRAGDQLQQILEQIVAVSHQDAKEYGGKMTASPKFDVCLVDQRKERGQIAVGMWPSMDKDSENQIFVTARLETIPDGARTVPYLQIHHQASYRRLFRLYKKSPVEHLLMPESNVKFRPHLMQNGSMAFIVVDEP